MNTPIATSAPRQTLLRIGCAFVALCGAGARRPESAHRFENLDLTQRTDALLINRQDHRVRTKRDDGQS